MHLAPHVGGEVRSCETRQAANRTGTYDVYLCDVAVALPAGPEGRYVWTSRLHSGGEQLDLVRVGPVISDPTEEGDLWLLPAGVVLVGGLLLAGRPRRPPPSRHRGRERHSR